MSTQNHVACLVDNPILGVGSNIVEKEVGGLFSGDHGYGLLGSDGTKSNKKFVVNCTSIVEECTNDFLDTVLAGIVQECRGICFRSELSLGAIGDG